MSEELKTMLMQFFFFWGGGGGRGKQSLIEQNTFKKELGIFLSYPVRKDCHNK